MALFQIGIEHFGIIGEGRPIIKRQDEITPWNQGIAKKQKGTKGWLVVCILSGIVNFLCYFLWLAQL